MFSNRIHLVAAIVVLLAASVTLVAASVPGTGASVPDTGASVPGTGASIPGTGASIPGTGAQPAALLATRAPGTSAQSTTLSRSASGFEQALAPSAGTFPARGDDTAPSLGTFSILVHPNFQSLMDGYPGYVSPTLESPLLSDPDTLIGRSDPHLHGDAVDAGGTAVGTAGTIVSDASFSAVPPGFQGPAGTREVHTEVRGMDMALPGPAGVLVRISSLVQQVIRRRTDAPTQPAVRAGIYAPDRPISPGEVESKDPSGDPANDFPAESFFDVFVEVDLPPDPFNPGGFPGGTLLNPAPLIVINDDLPEFPPKVVYTHGNTNAVPVVFKEDDPGGAWQAGDLFGWLVLAGHGFNYDYTFDDIQEFGMFMHQQTGMPTLCSDFHDLDFDGDGQVHFSDVNFPASRFHDAARYSPFYDTDQNRVIGAKDAQAVAKSWGEGCEVLTVPQGDDLFQTPAGSTFVDIELPPGFFGTKDGQPSDLFAGRIYLQGLPLSPPPTPTGSQNFQPQGQFNEVAKLAQHGVLDVRQGTGLPDTVVRRLADANLSAGGIDTIPVEIVALSLQSVEPIEVTYGGGNPSFFNVFVTLDSGYQFQGTMTLNRTGAFSGTFESTLPVRYVPTFQNVAGPSGSDQPAGPVSGWDAFHAGMGTGSPLGPGYDTGPPVPWTVPGP